MTNPFELSAADRAELMQREAMRVISRDIDTTIKRELETWLAPPLWRRMFWYLQGMWWRISGIWEGNGG